MTYDYFINGDNLRAYSITDFVAGLSQAISDGYPVDPDSARKVGISYEVSLTAPTVPDAPLEPAQQSTEQPEESNEGQSEGQENTAEKEAETGSEDSSEQYEGGGTYTLEDLQAMTTQELDDLAADFGTLKEFASHFDVTGRSKQDILDKLKELQDA